MDRDLHREEFDALLVELIGSENVYFQPPASVTMAYPCVVYNRDSSSESFADNLLYRFKQRYEVTVIDRNPDSSIPDKIRKLPYCSYSRSFVVDNLNHDVFNVFF